MEYAFPAFRFSIPGDPVALQESAEAYGRFATAAGESADGTGSLRAAGWTGTEGDVYREGIADLPGQLSTAQAAYAQTATALSAFGAVANSTERSGSSSTAGTCHGSEPLAM